MDSLVAAALITACNHSPSPYSANSEYPVHSQLVQLENWLYFKFRWADYVRETKLEMPVYLDQNDCISSHKSLSKKGE